MKQLFSAYTRLLVIAGAVLLFACNKNGANGLPSHEGSGNTALKQTKVLLIMMDGGTGQQIQQIAPPNLSAMMGNAIYSWNTISSVVNDSVSNAHGWADLLTGVRVPKHQVTTGFSGSAIATYPSLTTHLKNSGITGTTVITSSQSLTDNLLADAGQKFVLAGDAQVAAKAADILKTSDDRFILTQFTGADIAGTAGAYLATDAGYRAAVLNIDGYIKNLLDVLKTRTNYQNENWLVVVASNKGNNTWDKANPTWNVFDDNMHNAFLLFYNPRLVSQPQNKFTGLVPYSGVMYQYFVGDNSRSNRQGLANVPAGINYAQEFTYQLKIKVPVTFTGQWPPIISTETQLDGGPATGRVGWGVAIESGGTLRIYSGTSKSPLTAGSVFTGNTWHTVTIVYRRDNSTTRSCNIFIDGVKQASPLNANSANTTPLATEKLKVGYAPGPNNGGGASGAVYITDVRVYSVALPDAYVQSNYCSVQAYANDPYTNNLKGYWPSLDLKYNAATGKYYYEDKSGNGNDLVIQDPNTPGNTSAINEQTANVCDASMPAYSVAPGIYNTVLHTVDAAPEVLNWLGITPRSSWSFDGRSWPLQYVDVNN